MKSSIAHIRKLRATVRKYDLPRPAGFDALTDEQLQACYNGIGSEKFASLLWLTTRIFEVFEAPAMIHDAGWALYNDGTVTEWERSNNRFRAGNRIMAETCRVWFGWFRPAQRMLFRQSGELLYRVVSSQVIGWPIWAGSRTQGV